MFACRRRRSGSEVRKFGTCPCDLGRSSVGGSRYGSCMQDAPKPLRTSTLVLASSITAAGGAVRGSHGAPKLSPIDRARLRALCGCDERTIANYPQCSEISRRRIEAAADALGDVALPGRTS